jgi:hypothetical protein
MRLFNEPAGHKYLINKVGVPEETVSELDLLGFSSIANLIMCIKFAKYYELTQKDIILTVFTDSMDLYQSRLKEWKEINGEYNKTNAIRDFYGSLMAIKTDSMMELSYYDRKRIHNLKYFTWVEQQLFDPEELNRQWYEAQSYWTRIQNYTPIIDGLIIEFNEKVGLL